MSLVHSYAYWHPLTWDFRINNMLTLEEYQRAVFPSEIVFQGQHADKSDY